MTVSLIDTDESGVALCPDDEPGADPLHWTFWDYDAETYISVPKWFTDDANLAARMALWVEGMCDSAFGRGQRVGRISYNGRLWGPEEWTPGQQVVAEVPSRETA